MIGSILHDSLDATTRALVALAIGSDDPLFPSIPLGDAVSAMSATEAATFVSLCDAFVAGRLEAVYFFGEGVLRLRYAA